MSAKDRYSWKLKCPTCGREGEVHVVENDHAYAPPDTSVTSISDGFYVQKEGGTPMSTILACSTCRSVAG